MSRCPHERAFRASVNMSPSEIRAWDKDPRAKCYSKPATRARLKKLAALKEKPSARWTEADCKLAARVVSFNARMEGGMRRDGCTPGYSISLRNWGRKTKCSVPTTCAPSAFARGIGRGTRRGMGEFKTEEGTYERALEHAEYLSAQLKKNGFRVASVWHRPGVGVRVYLPGSQYVSVGRDGSILAITQGQEHFRRDTLPKSMRAGYDTARKDHLAWHRASAEADYAKRK